MIQLYKLAHADFDLGHVCLKSASKENAEFTFVRQMTLWSCMLWEQIVRCMVMYLGLQICMTAAWTKTKTCDTCWIDHQYLVCVYPWNNTVGLMTFWQWRMTLPRASVSSLVLLNSFTNFSSLSIFENRRCWLWSVTCFRHLYLHFCGRRCKVTSSYILCGEKKMPSVAEAETWPVTSIGLFSTEWVTSGHC